MARNGLLSAEVPLSNIHSYVCLVNMGLVQVWTNAIGCFKASFIVHVQRAPVIAKSNKAERHPK